MLTQSEAEDWITCAARQCRWLRKPGHRALQDRRAVVCPPLRSGCCANPQIGLWLTPDSIVPDLNNPSAWNGYAFNYNNPINFVDPSGHFPIWDILDIGSFFLSARDFFRSPSWANLGWWALDAVSLLPLVSFAWVRHAGKVDEIGDARRVVVELGSGDFANLPAIVANNRGARVIGTELPEIERWLDVARRNPGAYSDFDELLQNYEAAIAAGAEIWFLDYRSLPAKFADEVISIAPYPGTFSFGGEELASAMETAHVMANVVKPGGRIYVAADTVFTATDIAGVLGHKLDMSVGFTKLGPVPYASKYLRYQQGAYQAHVIDIVIP